MSFKFTRLRQYKPEAQARDGLTREMTSNKNPSLALRARIVFEHEHHFIEYEYDLWAEMRNSRSASEGNPNRLNSKLKQVLQDSAEIDLDASLLDCPYSSPELWMARSRKGMEPNLSLLPTKTQVTRVMRGTSLAIFFLIVSRSLQSNN